MREVPWSFPPTLPDTHRPLILCVTLNDHPGCNELDQCFDSFWFSCALTYLKCFALKLVNDASNFSQQERPGVDEVNPVHHDCDDAVPALETSSQAVFDKEGVAEHKTMLFISEKNRAFTSWADLKGRDTYTKAIKHITQLK